MNAIDLHELGKNFREDMKHPTLLFEHQGHAVYWLGIPEHTAFRCNTYLIVDNGEAILVDPGGNLHFEIIRERVGQIVAPERVRALILSHSDPDVAASYPLWVDLNPSVKVIASVRTHRILHHFGERAYDFYGVEEYPTYHFHSGKELTFFSAPFLHAPGSVVTWDPSSSFLFSGDILAAVDIEWKLVVPDFEKHILKLNLFHLDNMASGKAIKGFLRHIDSLDIKAILPHHGSIISFPQVEEALTYLQTLRCGTDLMYPDIH